MARAINGIELAVDAALGAAMMSFWLMFAGAKIVDAPAAFFVAAFCGLEVLAGLVRGHGAAYACVTAAASGAGMAAALAVRAIFLG